MFSDPAEGWIRYQKRDYRIHYLLEPTWLLRMAVCMALSLVVFIAYVLGLYG